MSGWFYDIDADSIVLSGDGRFTDVPLALVTGVEHDLAPEPLALFQESVRLTLARLDALRADPLPHPSPGVVVGASLLWAGAGHAALGEWGGFAGWSVLECVIAGTAAWNIAREPQAAVLVPLVGLDLLFRGMAAGEAARIARSRRSLLDSRRRAGEGGAPAAGVGARRG